jgi:hypothetical protein
MKWRVIEQKHGHIGVFADIPSNWNRPGADERVLWEGEAQDNSEAMHLAQKAVPGIELGAFGYQLKKP